MSEIVNPNEISAGTRDRLVYQDMDNLLKIAFAERFAAFHRGVDPQSSEHVWYLVGTSEEGEASGPVGDVVPVAELPEIRGNGPGLIQYIDELVNAANREHVHLLWSIQRTSQTGRIAFAEGEERTGNVYVCRIVEQEGKSTKSRGMGSAADLGVAIASAMLTCVNFDFYALHKELYPGKYIIGGLT